MTNFRNKLLFEDYDLNPVPGGGGGGTNNTSVVGSVGGYGIVIVRWELM